MNYTINSCVNDALAGVTSISDSLLLVYFHKIKTKTYVLSLFKNKYALFY